MQDVLFGWTQNGVVFAHIAGIVPPLEPIPPLNFALLYLAKKTKWET